MLMDQDRYTPTDRLGGTGQSTILVADDDASFRTAVRAILENAGHRVLEAADVEEARRELERNSPDLFILDVRMPGHNGLDLIRQLRARPSWLSLPIIVSSGCVSAADKATAFDAGATSFLPKPFNTSRLYQVVDQHLMANAA